MPDQEARLYFIHAVSPLHAGTGEGLGAVNLPTARERATGFPFLPGSSVKGVLRDAAEGRYGDPAADKLIAAFGPRQENAGEARAGLAFSDASLLALPVRSLYGTFGWMTCPLALRRLQRDAVECGITIAGLDAILGRPPQGPTALVAPDSVLVAGDHLLLEELEVPASALADAGTLGGALGKQLWPHPDDKSVPPGIVEARGLFSKRFAILGDDLFSFLTRVALEIRSRVPINDKTGTAEASGPWTEEHMPAETILQGLALGRRTQLFQDVKTADGKTERKGATKDAGSALAVLGEIAQGAKLLRFGGKSTVGLGRAYLRLAVKP